MLVRQRIAAAAAAASPSAMQLSHLSRRGLLTTITNNTSRPLSSSTLSSISRRQQQCALRSISRRTYSSGAPKPPKKKRAGFFRWTYRLTLFSILGLTGYLGYSIYLLRHPEDQFEPDPSKKTLVILGLFSWSSVELYFYSNYLTE